MVGRDYGSSVIDLIREKGFRVVESSGEKSYCFDAVVDVGAKKPFIIKAYRDLKECPITLARELRRLGRVLDSQILLIAEYCGGHKIQDGIFYRRYSILSMNLDTFEALLEGERIPLVYMEKGGIYVGIDNKKLKERREELGLSLGELAYQIGVSRKSVYQYEQGPMGTTPKVAERLAEVLGEEVIKTVNIEDLVGEEEGWIKTASDEEGEESYKPRIFRSEILIRVKNLLDNMGFACYMFKRTPFQMVSKKLAMKKNKTSRLFVKALKCAKYRSLRNDLKMFSELSEIIDAKTLIVSIHQCDEGEVERNVFVIHAKRLNRESVINCIAEH